jgi:uncharacterized phage protein (TIGR02218 family)
MKDFSPLGISNAAVGFPARIGVITRVDGTVIRFAESDTAIVVGSDTYAVVPGFQVSAVTHTINGDMPSCQMVAVHGLGATFDSGDIDAGLFDGATVQIYIVDRLNLTRKGLLFTGAISNIACDVFEHKVSFDVKGAASFSKILMTQKRSPMCRTDLFSVLCGLNKASYAVSATVASITNHFAFTVSGLAQADGYFSQGVAVTSAGVAFQIASWTNSSQTINTYLPSDQFLSVGRTMTLYPGCDKTMGPAGCGKFSGGNYLNFQGEPHFSGTAAAAQQV